MTDALETGRDVLRTEAAALHAMADAMPDGFADAVALIAGLSGRVVTSGIGKSGHVARKIAATLASTGTPALFLHPSEASHGDLGMIASGDAVLIASNSGGNAELGDVIAYTRRFGIPLLAISSRPDSALGRAADIPLILPPAPEACGLGMVPTTSTTMTLALGDALAVALLRGRGFRAEDFKVFHPGGRLGAQMARVGDLMHRDVPAVASDAPMADVLLAMTSGGFGLAVVVDGAGALAGIVTDGDLRRNMAGLMERTAGAVATRDPVTASPDMLAARALAVMNERRITALIVRDGDAPVGVVRLLDLLRAGVA
ncbi:KpsF/GutQ family sugar-phosphate isomerase [Jannaschia sp. LMIT008]|uniref:KpsF/GutQ family sugar-phosphate isomerase n=1 Tax=Jannaschia maritima TaxID=3032585 RepID=UPI002810CAE8|nr:KpsF/GutQ family sugar-phosphate isomerase [Jannaschia sp. LMIT008]